MGNREALIVATGTYQDPGLRQLRSPAQDAAALSRVLGDPDVGDYRIWTVVDETEATIRRTIFQFFADRSRDDLLLLHISCHGIKDDEGRLYFAATDTTRRALEVTAVRRNSSTSGWSSAGLAPSCCSWTAATRARSPQAPKATKGCT
jgi:hypothetical protein